MRILHTEWSDGLGGQEKRVLAELLGLASRGHDLSLACRAEARIRAEAEQHGVRTFVLPFRSPYDAASIVRLRRIFRDHAIEVVNTHSGVDSWVGGIAAKLARVPALVRTRHLNIPLKRGPLNFIHYLPDLYITCGENMRKTLVEHCRFPADRVTSIPTGVDERFFSVAHDPAAAAAFGLVAGTPVIANIGILRRVKGHETTLKAATTVLKAFPDARFLIVGDGPRLRELQQMADDLGIAGSVVFTGYCPDVGEVLSFADVSVLSSWSEGLPQSVLQSMAAGVPVVATRVGGVPEVVLQNETGLLVEAGDHAAFGRAIIDQLRDRDAAVRMAARARVLVQERHSARHMTDLIEEAYARLLRKQAA